MLASSEDYPRKSLARNYNPSYSEKNGVANYPSELDTEHEINLQLTIIMYFFMTATVVCFLVH